MEDQNLPTPPDQSSPVIQPSPLETNSPVAPNSSGHKKKPLLIFVLIIVVVTVLAAGVFVALSQKKTTTTTTKITKASTTATKKSSQEVSPGVVSISANSFIPSNIQVAVGTTITWTNTDTKPHSVTGDPYPANAGLIGFDSGVAFPANATYSFKFEKAGTFTYHDQFNPKTFKGMVVVK